MTGGPPVKTPTKPRIAILSDSVASRIAAGEVVEALGAVPSQ